MKRQKSCGPRLGKLVHQLPGVVTFAYDLRFRCMIARWKGIIEEIHFGGSIMPFYIIENLDLEKTSFRPSKWPRKLKPAKNSKLSKLSENCFEPFKKGGWPPISTWIKIRNRELDEKRRLHSKPQYTKSRNHLDHPSKRTRGSRSKPHQNFGISEFGISKVLLTKVGTLHGEIPKILKRSQPSIRWDMWRRSRKSSIFWLLGFQVDRGFLSPRVASREITKRRRTIHLEETRGNNPGFWNIF
jgi:hypothetical protein